MFAFHTLAWCPRGWGSPHPPAVRLLVQALHMVLDPLLLWVGTDVLGQLGFEAVGREAPAQLEGALGGSAQEVGLLPGGGKRVAGGASGPGRCLCPWGEAGLATEPPPGCEPCPSGS